MTNINILCHLLFTILLCGQNSPKHCPLMFFFCQTEGISMLRNELIQKEMVDCSQTSKSKEQKHKNKDYLKRSIYSLLQ